MSHLRLVCGTTPTWRPLERVAELWNTWGELPRLDPSEFMYMGALLRPQQPAAHLYKHVGTRRYLCLDAAGHAYQILAPTGAGVAARLLPDLRTAVVGVLPVGGPGQAQLWRSSAIELT